VEVFFLEGGIFFGGGNSVHYVVLRGGLKIKLHVSADIFIYSLFVLCVAC